MNATPNLNDVPHDLHPATFDLQGTRYKLRSGVQILTWHGVLGH